MRTLVLNAGYEPLAVVSFKRALVLVMNQKASVVAEDDGDPVRSATASWARPSVIVLRNYVRIPNSRHAPSFFSAAHIFAQIVYTLPQSTMLISSINMYSTFCRRARTWSRVATESEDAFCRNPSMEWYVDPPISAAADPVGAMHMNR